MRYVGSKKRIAKRIASEIQKRRSSQSTYWEPFVGGCNSFATIAPMFPYAYGSDSHQDLILMWDALINGWSAPTHISETEYHNLKNAPPSPLRGFVGFGGSFGGKWFGGYARGGYNSDGTPRNYIAESSRAVTARIKTMTSTSTTIRFHHKTYLEGSGNQNMVIYCDPPYRGTLPYKQAPFDHDQFWSWCTSQVLNGALVLVSEYTAGDDWICVAEFPHNMQVSSPNARRDTTEKLFMHKSQAHTHTPQKKGE